METKLNSLSVLLIIIFIGLILAFSFTNNSTLISLFVLFMLIVIGILLIAIFLKIRNYDVWGLIKNQSKWVKISLVLWAILLIYDIYVFHTLRYSYIFPGLIIFIIFFKGFFKK